MVLAYRASGAFTEANSTSSGSIGLPAGLADGDVLILPVQARGTAGTVATPSGYTRAGEINITASHRLVVFYRYVASAAGEVAPTVTQTVSGAIRARLSAFSGGSSTTPLDVTAVFADSRDALTVTAPTATPVSQGAMAVWIFSTGDDNTLNAATQGTTAYSSDGTAGADGSLALVYELQTNATPVGTCSMTESANGPDNWNTATLILRPAPVAAANPSRTLYPGVTYAVEAAFGATPFAPDPTWTDISEHVRVADGMVVTRGRTSEFTDMQPGTMSLTLNNRGRLFDPTYSAGTYFGQLLPQTRIRLRVRFNSTNYPIFDGYVQGWPQSYAYPNEAVVKLTAVDLFSRLATRELPPTALSLAVLADDPFAYYPLYEDHPDVGGPVADLSGNGRDSFGRWQAADTFLTGEPGAKCKSVNLQLPTSITESRDPFVGAGATVETLRSMEVWYQPDDLVTSGNYSALNTYGYSANATIRLSVFGAFSNGDTGPVAYYDINDATDTLIGSIEAFAPPEGSPCYMAAVLNDTGTLLTCYLNGQVIGFINTSAATFEGGSGVGVCRFQVANDTEARIAHIAVYETELSAARVLAHWDAGTTGGNLQTVGSRMDELVAFCGLDDAGLYDDSALEENTYLGRASYSGNALSAMQELAATEQGRLFVAGDGVLTIQGRTADMGALTVNSVSQATLADSGANAYVTVEPDSNSLELMRNAVYVSTVGGATVSAIDFDARAQYDELSESIQTALGDPTAARNLGLSRTRRFADPSTRIPQIQLKPRTATDARYPIVFGAELGWRFTMQRTPQGVGSAMEFEETLEGLSIVFGEGHLTADLYLVPAAVVEADAPWFTFGTGEFGDEYLLHY